MTDQKPWHEDDQLWAEIESPMFDKVRIDAATGEVDKIIRLLNLQPGLDVLDLCCGIGRHALEFARRGYKVTGVDRTRRYIDRAVETAREENLKVEFIQSDMRDFLRPESFDIILNMLTSFGYFEDIEEDKRVLRNIYTSLKPGGRLILETKGKEVLARVFQARDWSEEGDLLILYERKLSDDWGMMNVTQKIIKNGYKKILHLRHRLFSAAELKRLAADAGFNKFEIYGDLDGAPYDNAADWLIFIAEK